MKTKKGAFIMKISDLQTLDYLLKSLGERTNNPNRFKLVSDIKGNYWLGDYIENYNYDIIRLDVVSPPGRCRDITLSNSLVEQDGFSIAQIVEASNILISDDNQNYFDYIVRNICVKPNLLLEFLLDIVSKTKSYNTLPEYLFNPVSMNQNISHSIPVLRLTGSLAIEPVSIISEPLQN